MVQKSSYIYTKFKTMSQITANVSNKFKRSAQKSVFAIVLFIVVYILLVISSAVLAFYCMKIGLAIIMNVKGLWGIIGALGLMATGLIVFFFLFKFFFQILLKMMNVSVFHTLTLHESLYNLYLKSILIGLIMKRTNKRSISCQFSVL